MPLDENANHARAGASLAPDLHSNRSESCRWLWVAKHASHLILNMPASSPCRMMILHP